MKLNINPKEVLALYDVLYERFGASTASSCQQLYAEGDLREPDDTQLRELYKRLRAILIGSLSNKAIDPLDSWIEGQNRKIGELKDENQVVVKEVKDLANEIKNGSPVILSAEDTDVLPDTYPRKGHAPFRPHNNRGGRGRR